MAVVVGSGAYGVADRPKGIIDCNDTGRGEGWLMIGRTDDGPAGPDVHGCGRRGVPIRTAPLVSRVVGTMQTLVSAGAPN